MPINSTKLFKHKVHDLLVIFLQCNPLGQFEHIILLTTNHSPSHLVNLAQHLQIEQHTCTLFDTIVNIKETLLGQDTECNVQPTSTAKTRTIWTFDQLYKGTYLQPELVTGTYIVR